MFTYYSSNFDKIFKADKKGNWIAYRTESGDEDAIHIPFDKYPNPIQTKDEAFEILQKYLDWEWEQGIFCAKVKNWGFLK